MHLVKKLYDLSCRDYYGKMSGLTDYSEKRLGTVFDYLAGGKDHPVIQAGIIQPEILSIKPFDYGNGKVARLLSYVYFYRAGYDFRGMLNMEEYYKRDIVTYERMTEAAKVQGNMTAWLEYFTDGVKTQLIKAFDIIKHLKFQEEIKLGFWKLNTRQQEVLEILENPNGKVTNKDVVKRWGVSQITSSRDLARLVSLGLLLSHGHGRSVYYTRV